MGTVKAYLVRDIAMLPLEIQLNKGVSSKQSDEHKFNPVIATMNITSYGTKEIASKSDL